MSPDGSSQIFHRIPRRIRLDRGARGCLRRFAALLAREVAGGRPFCCLFTSDEELHRLNREFLGHDYPTDVLSFPAAAPAGPLGEIAISVERAEAQAARYGHLLIDEIRVLMLHGVLHLTGLDHESDRGSMARAERKWRGAFALPGTVIARARAWR